MFDNELKIDDEILQEVLAGRASAKMRNIVNTIQREQNRAIRNDKDPLLLVEGPAGSGKTSVALHRIAYLLYRQRAYLRSENVLIFTQQISAITFPMYYLSWAKKTFPQPLLKIMPNPAWIGSGSRIPI